jgi:hypothetical protein
MKFFTPELHVRFQDFTNNAAMNGADAAFEAAQERYDQHLQAIEPEMPPCYRQFDGLLLHDAHVWTIARQGDELIMVLHKDIPPRDVVILTYTLSEEPWIDQEAFPPLYRSHVMDFTCDEFDLIDEGGRKEIVQSILFGNGWEIRLRFRDVKVTLATPLYPIQGMMLVPASTSVTLHCA